MYTREGLIEEFNQANISFMWDTWDEMEALRERKVIKLSTIQVEVYFDLVAEVLIISLSPQDDISEEDEQFEELSREIEYLMGEGDGMVLHVHQDEDAEPAYILPFLMFRTSVPYLPRRRRWHFQLAEMSFPKKEVGA